jgi:phosphatidylinositol dimannoside acyltransferase
MTPSAGREATGGAARERGTPVQRLRAAGLAALSWLACRLPEAPLVAVADGVGAAWYRLAPGRAARARRNLARVVAHLAATGMGPERVRAAAGDDRALERLVRAAFRHDARYYLDVVRAPALTAEYFDERITVETPEVVEQAFAGDRPVIFIAGHFGAIELPGLYLARRSGRRVVAPMEAVDDPALQDWFVRTRSSFGVRIVSLRDARRALLAALRAGEHVGLVADRDIAGGGIEVELFGAPAPLPIGPALLAVETGAPIFAAGVRRVGGGRLRGRLVEVPVATEGARRERIAATLAAEARAFERLISDAPEQWSAVFFPIWPDLESGAPTATEPAP